MATFRTRAAVFALRATNALSRAAGRGQGTVVGGRVGLAVDPELLEHLARGRQLALVSGTNGKTTTTAMLAAALGADGAPVATNSTGSNMPAGHVAALAASPETTRVVLEVDEGYLPRLLDTLSPALVLLLNLSRDQLDRMSEVRMLAERWQRALAASPGTLVVANADDPLVVFAARSAARVRWVAAGLAWQQDAVGCPSCGGQIHHGASSWACDRCDLARPEASWVLAGDLLRGPEVELALELALPGAFNRDNALMAIAAASELGVQPGDAASALSTLRDVAGRFVVRAIGATTARLMLAKNPAGWTALLDLVVEDAAPVVVAINARTADGLDPSWLWDVGFAALAGRRVVASGERWRDLSVRLSYAGVEHRSCEDPVAAVAMAGSGDGPVDVIGNYTAFHELLASR